MTKYRNLALEKNVSEKELSNNIDYSSKYFSFLDMSGLSNLYLAYKTPEDTSAPEFPYLCDEMKSRDQFKRNSKKSIDEIAKKYKMTKTDYSSLNFYKKLNKRGVKPEESNVSYLRFDILDVFGYDKLNAKSIGIKDSNGNVLLDENGDERKLKIKKNLENLQPENVRGFAMNRYYAGEKVWERLKK